MSPFFPLGNFVTRNAETTTLTKIIMEPPSLMSLFFQFRLLNRFDIYLTANGEELSCLYSCLFLSWFRNEQLCNEWNSFGCKRGHYSDVIMGAITSQITSLTIVYSTVYSNADQRKHQSSSSLAFVWGIHRWPVNSPYKGPVTRKMFPFDDVIMVLQWGWFHNYFQQCKWFNPSGIF